MNLSTAKNFDRYSIGYDPVKIRFGKLTSSRDILGLFKVIFDRDFQEDLIEWFANCPTGSNIWYGAFESDVPVGLYGLLPIRIKVGGQVCNGALCNNVGVIPKYYGRGLFQALGEYALGDAQLPLAICQPNIQAARGHKVVGWESCGILELLNANLEEKKIDYVKYSDFQYVPRSHQPYFHIVKDQDFFMWRYRRPYMEYYQSFFDGGHYAVWKYYQGRKQILEISDFRLVLLLGGPVDILQFKDSSASDELKKGGFKPVLANEFLIYGKMALDRNMDTFNFEPGDNDVL